MISDGSISPKSSEVTPQNARQPATGSKMASKLNMSLNFCASGFASAKVTTVVQKIRSVLRILSVHSSVVGSRNWIPSQADTRVERTPKLKPLVSLAHATIQSGSMEA